LLFTAVPATILKSMKKTLKNMVSDMVSLKDFVLETILTLSQNLPLIENIQLSKLTFGSNHPIISGMRAHPHSEGINLI